MTSDSIDTSNRSSEPSTDPPRGGDNRTARSPPENETGRDIGYLPTTTPPCPDCGTSEHLVVDDTETYCEECGLVVASDDLDRSIQWVNTEAGRIPERGGSPLTVRRHDRGLSTKIGRNRDGNGHTLPSQTRLQFGRLRKWHTQAQTSTTRERSLRLGLGEIARLISALELSRSIHDRAADLFRDASKQEMLVGRSVEAIASATVLAACRLERLPRQLEEIGDVARVAPRTIQRAYSHLKQELRLQIPPLLPQDFVPKLASALEASPRVERRALQLASSPPVVRHSNGRQPSGVAAACVYYAYRELGEDDAARITQSGLASESNTSAPTIRTTWQELNRLSENGELPHPESAITGFR